MDLDVPRPVRMYRRKRTPQLVECQPEKSSPRIPREDIRPVYRHQLAFHVMLYLLFESHAIVLMRCRALHAAK